MIERRKFAGRIGEPGLAIVNRVVELRGQLALVTPEFQSNYNHRNNERANHHGRRNHRVAINRLTDTQFASAEKLAPGTTSSNV
jgi:lipase chaperone LimK